MIYYITCLNPDCAEDDSSEEQPNQCQFCGTTDIEVTTDED